MQLFTNTVRMDISHPHFNWTFFLGSTEQPELSAQHKGWKHINPLPAEKALIVWNQTNASSWPNKANPWSEMFLILGINPKYDRGV